MNDSQGYDVISLPGGITTKVFTKQEYRISKEGHQLIPSAGPSRPGKGSGKGKEHGKRNADQSSMRHAKTQRVEGRTALRQLHIEDFNGTGQSKVSRWVRVSK